MFVLTSEQSYLPVNCTRFLCARPEVLRAQVIWDDMTVLDLRQMEPDAELNICRLLTAPWQQSVKDSCVIRIHVTCF